MASSGTSQEKNQDPHIELIKVFEPLLRESFIASHVTTQLCSVIKLEGMNQVRKEEKLSVGDGVSKLLELLIKSGEPGWFEAFIKALKDNDYDLLADHLLCKREMKDSHLFKELLAIFCKRIVDEVDPTEVMYFLLERDTISKEDLQEIKEIYDREGRKDATLALLFRQPMHRNDWFADFIAALNKVGTETYKQLAEDIEPVVYKACALHEEREASDKFQTLNQHPPNVKERETDMEYETITEVHQEYEEMDPESTPLGAGINKIAKHYPDGKNISSKSSTPETLNNLSASSLASQVRGDYFNVTAESPDVNVEGSEVVESQRQASSKECDKTNSLELRSYQKELAEPALSGKNVIIVAPTGSGKTHVALYITQNHFAESGRRKVVFFVPTTELVSQQRQMYSMYLNTYKVYGLSGEVPESEKMPISSLIDRYDILVMTPQILLNALQKKDVLSLRVFTLMIFDECHHATKKHPYNNILAVYLDEKYRQDRDYLLPQIVGLTASVGVGHARDTAGVIKHILTLCANLDTTNGISVVDKHLKELEEFVNKPNEIKIETHEREEDPFRDTITNLMSEIETRITNHIAKQNITTLSSVLDIPAVRRGSDQYTQWLSRLHKEVAKIYEQNIRTPIYACRAHLMIYNTALMINEDCRTVDSLSYLLKTLRDVDPQHKDDTDIWLESLFNRHKNELRRISEDPRYYNPKLNKLAALLLEKYQSNADMRAIIFCKTREMTMALQKWIEETPKLTILSPNRLVGANASAEKGGMTQHKQEDVLRYFKDGKHKVIIATSVAEEGLDVSKCNLVIRYEYISNEIAMVQARGRGRAEDSDYVVLGDHSRGAAQREGMNKIKENMMNNAIKEVKRMPDDTLEKKILELQREVIEQRKMNEVARMTKAAALPQVSGDEWELRCHKCDALGCLANDIRLFAMSHHMVLDESFVDRVDIEKHPDPKQLDEILKTDKMFCKKCHHDWGICVIYKSVKVCVIKVSSFRVINTITNDVFTPRKWKDAPFSVASLKSSELEQYATACSQFNHCN